MSKKDNNNVNMIDFNKGKVLPSSMDIENEVLGIMITFPMSVYEVKELIKPDDFYYEKNQIICECIFNVAASGGYPDLIMIVDNLRKVGKLEQVGGAYHLTVLTNNVISEINLKRNCLNIKAYSIKRKLIEMSYYLLSKSFDDTQDVFELLSEAEEKLRSVNHELEELKFEPLTDIASDIIRKMEKRVYDARNNIDTNDIYTGMEDWDRINGPLFPGLYVVAGRPAMGKGVHMVEIICRMAKKVTIGVISGEMPKEQLMRRIAYNLGGINNMIFKKDAKYISDDEIVSFSNAMEEVVNLKLLIDESVYIDRIVNKVRYWVEKLRVRCVLADFLTLFNVPAGMENKFHTDTAAINYVLKQFVRLSKDLKIPIILYSQMNRGILSRATKEPNLSDLKQSGSIEELAYQVSFLHRPEYYDTEATQDEHGESVKGLCYQIIAKHREGETGRIKYRVHLGCSQMNKWVDEMPMVFEKISEAPF